MSGILRTLTGRVATSLRLPAITQRASISARPAKEKFGVLETCVGLVMFSLAILGPSGWILAHLEDYKKKD